METIKRPIQNLLPDYIKYKKSLGYKYDNISHFYNLLGTGGVYPLALAT